MTREELKKHCEKEIEMCEFWAISKGEKPSGKIYEEHKLILELLEQEPCEVEAAQLQQVYIKGFEDCKQAVLASIKNLYPDMPVVDIFGARRKWLEKYAPYFECENAVEQLPPVTPHPEIIKERDT